MLLSQHSASHIYRFSFCKARCVSLWLFIARARFVLVNESIYYNLAI